MAENPKKALREYDRLVKKNDGFPPIGTKFVNSDGTENTVIGHRYDSSGNRVVAYDKGYSENVENIRDHIAGVPRKR